MDEENGKSKDDEANASEEAARDLLATIDAVYDSLSPFGASLEELSLIFFDWSFSLMWSASLLRLLSALGLWAGAFLFIRLVFPLSDGHISEMISFPLLLH